MLDHQALALASGARCHRSTAAAGRHAVTPHEACIATAGERKPSRPLRGPRIGAAPQPVNNPLPARQP